MGKKIGIIAISLVVVLGIVFGAVYVSDKIDQKSEDKAPSSQTKSDETTTKDDTSKEAPKQNSAKDESQKGDISKKDAEKIALDEFGGSIKETESDDYKGTPAWEVEVRDSKHGRIEVKVAKSDGKILHWEKDD